MRKAQLLALSILLIGIGQNIAQDENHGQGLIFADEEEYKNIPLASTNLMGTLPEKYDLSGSFPIPGNQANQYGPKGAKHAAAAACGVYPSGAADVKYLFNGRFDIGPFLFIASIGENGGV